jgi:serine/threonine-protein kinase
MTDSPGRDVDPSCDTLVVPELQSRPLAGGAPVSGYDLGATLGVGGMGEVVLARDAKIGREVALKRMRAVEPTDEALARFLREARIQARLDHPAIVPVHELGSDADGRPYFTMKRLVGTTLQDSLRAANGLSRRVLGAFVDVCFAIEFAHARGVVHRDLKPENIMLGDYGEVYVLDWGLARTVGDPANEAVATSDARALEGHTQAGALLGTPGYMAPEQARGENVGPSADVYALGAILFEILAGEPLHPRGTPAALASTATMPTQAPAQRRPERAIPPELDAACLAALAMDPAHRPTARTLAELVQAYLDGDRDLERRRELAREELSLARTIALNHERRAEAVRLAGRALVLDPESSEAAALVLQLLLEPPAQLPAELTRELEAHDSDIARRAARVGIAVPLAYAAFVPVLLWMGVRDWSTFAITYAIVGLMAIVTIVGTRALRPQMYVPLALNAALMICLSRLLSPWIFAPSIICAFTSALASQMGLWRRPALLLGVGIAALLVPLGLEGLGVFGRTWSVDGGRLVLESVAVTISSPSIIVMLIGGSVASIAINTLFSTAVAASRDQARRQVAVHAWHLRQLIPVDASPVIAPRERC